MNEKQWAAVGLVAAAFAGTQAVINHVRDESERASTRSCQSQFGNTNRDLPNAHERAQTAVRYDARRGECEYALSTEMGPLRIVWNQDTGVTPSLIDMNIALRRTGMNPQLLDVTAKNALEK